MKGENVIPGAASTIEKLHEFQYVLTFIFLEPHLYLLQMVAE